MSTPMPAFRVRTEEPDAHLVARVLGGDPDAYSGLVHRHQDAIYRHARGMGLDHDTSADLVQDAFVKAFDRLAECREGAHYRAWLFRICRNLCLDELRDVRRRHSVPMSELEDADGFEHDRGTPDEITLTLRAALERVPHALREAFLLKHDAGYTYEEIAVMTDASPSAVKMRVHRAREALREFLVSQGITGENGTLSGCDNRVSPERLRSVDSNERTASLANATGTPAKTIRRIS
jgi:RNA polymerase sigma-70 factor (ECF subfamily)